MPNDLLTQDWGAALGYILAAATGAVVGVKKLSNMLKVSDSGTRATVDGTQRLFDIIDQQRLTISAEREDKAVLQSLLDEANKRTDKANEERNSMVRELSEIRSQLTRLEYEVKQLRKEAGYDE